MLSCPVYVYLEILMKGNNVKDLEYETFESVLRSTMFLVHNLGCELDILSVRLLHKIICNPS